MALLTLGRECGVLIWLVECLSGERCIWLGLVTMLKEQDGLILLEGRQYWERPCVDRLITHWPCQILNHNYKIARDPITRILCGFLLEAFGGL